MHKSSLSRTSSPLPKQQLVGQPIQIKNSCPESYAYCEAVAGGETSIYPAIRMAQPTGDDYDCGRKGLHFRRLWQRILKLLGEQNPAEKEMRLKRFSIDGTLLQSFEFQDKTGYSGKHRRVGVKASLVVDATGLPLRP